MVLNFHLQIMYIRGKNLEGVFLIDIQAKMD